MKAGTRKRFAAIHAMPSPKQMAVNPKGATNRRLTSTRAIISITPDHIASLVNPSPCMEYLNRQSVPNRKKNATEVRM